MFMTSSRMSYNMLLGKLCIQHETEMGPGHAVFGGDSLNVAFKRALTELLNSHEVGVHERSSSSPTLGKSLHFRLSSLPCFLL